jgi:hypothetical protein
MWRDFHTSFLTYFRSAVMPLVVPKYYVRIEHHVYVDEADGETRRTRYTDADVVLDRNGHSRPSGGAAAIATRPKKLKVPRVSKRYVGYLVVRTIEDEKIVTVIELLSPSNKDGSTDQESYLVKRRELLASNVNFVEIDLLRGGTRMPIKGLKACDYYTLVSRPPDRPTVDVCPFRLRDKLPIIPVPLERDESEPTIDLKVVLDRVYDEAGYEYRLYRTSPEPPLSPTEAAWAKDILAKTEV